jgi:hypothetical protein
MVAIIQPDLARFFFFVSLGVADYVLLENSWYGFVL